MSYIEGAEIHISAISEPEFFNRRSYCLSVGKNRQMRLDFFGAKPSWLPLAVVVLMAITFEPIRSEFTLANQPCEFIPTGHQFTAAFFNLKHTVGYGVICLLAIVTMRSVSVWRVVLGVLFFSAFMELFQSFFSTGHCRLWDLIPNLIGIASALALFLVGKILPGK